MTKEEILRLKKTGLWESVKRFQQINEYTFMGSNDILNEVGDDDEEGDVDPGSDNETPSANDMAAGGQNAGNGPMGGPDSGPAGNPDDNRQPGGTGGQEGGDGDQDAPEPQFDGSGDEPEDGPAADDGEMDDIDVDDEDEDTEYVDVDDLTDAQEEMSDRMEDLLTNMSKKIAGVAGMLDDMVSKLDKNDAEIDSLKAEIERRNPTDTERMNLRVQDGQPFNLSPEAYFRNGVRHPNYEIYSDNSESPADEVANGKKEYVLRRKDVDDLGSVYDLAKSLDTELEDGKRSLSDILKFS